MSVGRGRERGLTWHVVTVRDDDVAICPQTKCGDGGGSAGASTNSGLKQIGQKLNELNFFFDGERLRGGHTWYVVAVCDDSVAVSPQTKCGDGGGDAGASTDPGLKQIGQKMNELELFFGGERLKGGAYLVCRCRSQQQHGRFSPNKVAEQYTCR